MINDLRAKLIREKLYRGEGVAGRKIVCFRTIAVRASNYEIERSILISGSAEKFLAQDYKVNIVFSTGTYTSKAPLVLPLEKRHRV